MLSIIIDSLSETVAKTTEPSLNSETMFIAGKKIVVYWLEWARTHGIDTVNICTNNKVLSDERMDELYELYGVKITYNQPIDLDNSEHIYYGIGLFLNDENYKYIQSFDEFLKLEQKILEEPLTYSSSIGYGEDDQIQIGKNVYLHSSVKLSGKVIIGDDCTIGKNVTIENSTINNNSRIQTGSTIINAYIGSNVQMLTDIHLEGKALFPSRVYDIASKQVVEHEGICLQN